MFGKYLTIFKTAEVLITRTWIKWSFPWFLMNGSSKKLPLLLFKKSETAIHKNWLHRKENRKLKRDPLLRKIYWIQNRRDYKTS